MDPLALSVLHIVVAVWGIRLAVIDAQHHRLPNRLTGSLALVVGLWGLVWGESALLDGALRESALTTAAYALFAVLPTKPLGWGDVKLQASLGFYAGVVVPGGGFLQAILSFVLGGMWAGWLLVRRKIEPHDGVAFGPFMVAATFVTVWGFESVKII